MAPLLLEGLQRLEYRGYDSAGIVVTSPKTAGLKMVKAKGRVRDLEAKVPRASRAPPVSPTPAGPPTAPPPT